MLGLFRFHLAMYNLANKKKDVDIEDDNKKRKKRIGEPPVILDSIKTKKSVKQISLFLYNKGYFRSFVTDSIVYKKPKLKKNRGGKAKVYYKAKLGPRYKIGNIKFDIKDENE